MAATQFEELIAAIKARRGAPLVIDASQAAIGTPVLQLLLACQREWSAAGHDFHIEDGGGLVAAACRRLGITQLAVGTKENSI
jgi:anti-anti-sigma regulatory factor